MIVIAKRLYLVQDGLANGQPNAESEGLIDDDRVASGHRPMPESGYGLGSYECPLSPLSYGKCLRRLCWLVVRQVQFEP